MLDKLARYSIIIVICNRNLGNYKRLLKLSFLFSRHMYKLRFFTVDPNDVLKWKKYTQFHFVFFKLSQNCSINPTFTTHTLVFSINLRILCRLSFFIFQRQGREGGVHPLQSRDAFSIELRRPLSNISLGPRSGLAYAQTLRVVTADFWRWQREKYSKCVKYTKKIYCFKVKFRLLHNKSTTGLWRRENVLSKSL